MDHCIDLPLHLIDACDAFNTQTGFRRQKTEQYLLALWPYEVYIDLPVCTSVLPFHLIDRLRDLLSFVWQVNTARFARS